MQNQDRAAYRRAARECLDIAGFTAEHDTRTRLVMLACKFYDLAQAPEDDGPARRLLVEGFSDTQLLKVP